MAAAVVAGDAFHVDPDGTNRPHLWVVLKIETPPLGGEDVAIIASMTSVKRHIRPDPGCLIQPNDPDKHAFVTIPTYIMYDDLREYPVSELVAKLGCERRDPVSAALLRRMHIGVHVSKLTDRGFKRRIPDPRNQPKQAVPAAAPPPSPTGEPAVVIAAATIVAVEIEPESG